MSAALRLDGLLPLSLPSYALFVLDSFIHYSEYLSDDLLDLEGKAISWRGREVLSAAS